MSDNLEWPQTEAVSLQEDRKRKREWFSVLVLLLVFLILTWVEFRLVRLSEGLPFVHSVFFFGLVNFNIILFLLLIFMIFRNVAKVFAEREKGWVGRSLKGKLIAAFVGFSFVPTALMFLVSVFYINNSFDKWFSEKMAGVLKSSIEVTNAYYLSAKKKNYHFATLVASELAGRATRPAEIKKALDRLRVRYSLDVLEFYPGLFGERVLSSVSEELLPQVPEVSLEFRQKALSRTVESSMVHHFGEGDLIRVIVPITGGRQKAAVVASSFVPLSLISKREDIASAYQDFRDLNPLSFSIKSIYLIILVLMTLVILLGATWFGFYLAKQLSVPLELLASAARRVVKGEYKSVPQVSSSPEISELMESFNVMTDHLKRSEEEIQLANDSLRAALARLEVVLSNVTTGVVSVDDQGQITMINRHAARLLDVKADKYLGRKLQEVLDSEHYQMYLELLEVLSKHKATSLQREMHISINGRQVPFLVTVSILNDSSMRELGQVIVFDDLTTLLAAQRSAAWKEVARRIAHEIKNPLTPISLSAQRLRKKFGGQIEDPAFSECTSMIIRQVDELKVLVNEFSNFARLPKSRPVLAGLNKAIEQALVLFREAHKNVVIDFKADPELPDFPFDSDQMKRVVANLVDNSVWALQNYVDGRIDIRTEYDSLLKIARIVVVDNGPGLPKYLKERIFEPYVTTKKEGTGLGLAIVKRTIEDHNGFIRAFSDGSRGTTIVIELPVVTGASAVVKTTVLHEGGLT